MPRDSCYLQIILFENGARRATVRACQLPSQQLAGSLTVCGCVRKQLSLSICLAVTFSNTCDLWLHAWGLLSLRGLPSSLWTDKTPTFLQKYEKKGGERHSRSYIILCWSNSPTVVWINYFFFHVVLKIFFWSYFRCDGFFPPQDTLVLQNKTCLFSIPFSHHGRNPSLNIRTEKHLCGVDVTDLPGLPLTKAKVSLARATQWPFNQASALLRTGEQCYFLSQNYKDRVLQETWQTKPFRGKCFGRLLGLIFSH